MFKKKLWSGDLVLAFISVDVWRSSSAVKYFMEREVLNLRVDDF